jgi:hypothetical protein
MARPTERSGGAWLCSLAGVGFQAAVVSSPHVGESVSILPTASGYAERVNSSVVDWAEAIARQLLTICPERLLHVVGVGARLLRRRWAC